MNQRSGKTKLERRLLSLLSIDHLSKFAMEASVLLALFAAPLFMGGRHSMGRLALAAACVPGILGIFIRMLNGGTTPIQKKHLAILAACLTIPLIQSYPLDREVVNVLHPGREQVLKPDQPLLNHGPKTTLSISPATTQKAIPLIIVLICVFVVFTCRIETLKDIEWLMRILMWSGLCIAAIAILQANFGNGKFVWWYEHPFRDPGRIPRGPFQNENHLSSLLATILPVILFFLTKRQDGSLRHPRADGIASSKGYASREDSLIWSMKNPLPKVSTDRIVATIACVLIVTTILMTPSRGGTGAVVAAGVVWFSIQAWLWIGRNRASSVSSSTWLRLGMAGGMIAITAVVSGLLLLIEKYSFWRAKIWSIDLQMWRDNPVLGVGAGNHRNMYRPYLDEYFPKTFSHAESSWIQYLAETGMVGFALALGITLYVLYILAQGISSTDPRGRSIAIAAMAGLVTSAVHAVGDFAWHIPSCFVAVLCLVAIALRLRALCTADRATRTIQRSKTRTSSRCKSQPIGVQTVTGFAIAPVLLLALGWSTSKLIPDARAAIAWDEYVRAHEGSEEADTEDSKTAIELLRYAIRNDSAHLLARNKLTFRLARRLQVADLPWDERARLATTALKESIQSIRICPSNARPYLHAAIALKALGGAAEQRERLLITAQSLRPTDGIVAMKLGLLQMVRGESELAERQFATALEDPSCTDEVLAGLSLLYSSKEIIAKWQPDSSVALLLFLKAESHGSKSQMRRIGSYLCHELIAESHQSENEATQHRSLKHAYRYASKCDDVGLMRTILNEQLAFQPNSLELLLRRARLHLRIGDIAAAAKDLERCQEQAPGLPDVRKLAFQIQRLAVKSGTGRRE